MKHTHSTLLNAKHTTTKIINTGTSLIARTYPGTCTYGTTYVLHCRYVLEYYVIIILRTIVLVISTTTTYQYYYVLVFSKKQYQSTRSFHLIRHSQPTEGRVDTPTQHTITTITRLTSSYHTQPADRREGGYTYTAQH